MKRLQFEGNKQKTTEEALKSTRKNRGSRLIFANYGRCPIRGRAGGLMHYRWFREGQEVICWLILFGSVGARVHFLFHYLFLFMFVCSSFGLGQGRARGLWF